jgi:glycosyltransferase involved in cell wall biosynthesis
MVGLSDSAQVVDMASRGQGFDFWWTRPIPHQEPDTMSDPIRILYLVDSIADPDRPTVAHLHRLATGLDPLMFSPTVWSIQDSEPEVAGILPCACGGLAVKTSGLLASLVARQRLGRIVRSGGFDLVCAFDVMARVIGLPAARAAGMDVCLAAVRDMGQALSPQSLTALHRANDAVSRFVANAAAVAQRLVRQELVRRDRIDVIPDGIDLTSVPARTPETHADAKHRLGLSLHQAVILLDAPLERVQDHPTFLAAIAHLREHHPNARFIILGSGPDGMRNEIVQEAERLGVSPLIIMTSDPRQRQLWYQAADVAVQTSPLEGCSSALLYSMAAGVPSVAAAAGGHSELIVHGQTGYLFPARDPDALAMRIHLLLAARDVAAEFAEAARRRVRDEYAVSLEVRRFTDYYHSLVYSSIGERNA